MSKYIPKYGDISYMPGVYHVGDNSNRAILSESQVRVIKRHIKEKTKTRKELAERYHISKSTIDMIAAGKRWAHVELE